MYLEVPWKFIIFKKISITCSGFLWLVKLRSSDEAKTNSDSKSTDGLLCVQKWQPSLRLESLVPTFRNVICTGFQKKLLLPIGEHIPYKRRYRKMKQKSCLRICCSESTFMSHLSVFHGWSQMNHASWCSPFMYSSSRLTLGLAHAT